jgi:hypothetical protein
MLHGPRMWQERFALESAAQCQKIAGKFIRVQAT